MTRTSTTAAPLAAPPVRDDPTPASDRRSSRRHPLAAAGTRAAVGLVVPVLAVLLWHLGVRGGWTLPFGIRMQYLPLPTDVAVRIWDLATGATGIQDSFSGQLWVHLWASTSRVLQGFGLAAVVAVPLGVAMGRSALLSRLLDPMLTVVRPIPVTAWAPLSLLIIGFGDRSAVFLVFLAALFPVVLNTVSAVREVPPRLIEAARMLGTRRLGVMVRIVIPAAAPGIVGGLRIAMGLSWVILVVGETVGISIGLGSMITQARDNSRTDLIVAGMIVIGLAGFVSDRVLLCLIRLLTRGRPVIA